MNEYAIRKHSDCNLSIRWKLFKGRLTPTAGLFCQDHDEFIMWLDDNLAYDLIDNHKMLVEEYLRRPTSKQRKLRAKELRKKKPTKITP
jgi:hypothetical protein